MIDNKYIVNWDSIDKNTFMYGSCIEFDKGVMFENLLMPSGTVIHEWFMTSQYFSTRLVPSLPILKRGYHYKLEIKVESTPKNSVYLKIKFYRRDKSIIDSMTVTTDDFSFIYPEDAYEYSIELLSASVERFYFEYMTITEMRHSS